MTELLWRLVGDSPTEQKFIDRISVLSNDEIRQLALQYLNVRYALMQALWEHQMDKGASEDTIEDVVDWLILHGPKALTATLEGEPPLPPREQWSGLEEHSLFHALAMEVKRRFNDTIYEVTGHEYPYPWTTKSKFKHVDYLVRTDYKN